MHTSLLLQHVLPAIFKHLTSTCFQTCQLYTNVGRQQPVFAGCWKPCQAYSESAFVSARPHEPPSFVWEPQRQRACKIDELVHALLLRGQSGGVSVSNDTASDTHTHMQSVVEESWRKFPRWLCARLQGGTAPEWIRVCCLCLHAWISC